MAPSPAPSAGSTDNPLLQCKCFHMSRSITSSPPYTYIPCHYPKGPSHKRSPCLTLPPSSDEKVGGGGLWNASGTAPHAAISATVGAATGCFHSRVLSVTFGAVPSGHVYRISLALIFADKCSQSRCVGPLSLRGCYTKAHLL